MPDLDQSDDPRIHVGDTTVLEVTVVDQAGAAVNISAASALTIYLTKPDRTVLTKTASLVTTGADGKMQYAALTTDFDTPGVWKIQGRVAGAGGFTGSTREASFTVFSSRHGV